MARLVEHGQVFLFQIDQLDVEGAVRLGTIEIQVLRGTPSRPGLVLTVIT